MSDLAEDLEWEEWDPSKISFVHHMLAGSVAGLVEHISIFPIDTIKTHMQYETKVKVSPLQSWKSAVRIVGNEGFFRLWRGVSAMFAGCIPAHAAYFSIFETSKKILGADQPGHRPIQAAACGALAAISHDVFMTPFDMVKQRMQLGYYRNIRHCVRSIVRTEGVSALYVSFPTTLMMNIPYGCIMVAVNESMKKVLNPSEKYNFSASMIAGSVAGIVAAAFTNPLDVVKTRLQTQNLEFCPKGCTDPAAINKNSNNKHSIYNSTSDPFSSSSKINNSSNSTISHRMSSAKKLLQPDLSFYTSSSKRDFSLHTTAPRAGNVINYSTLDVGSRFSVSGSELRLGIIKHHSNSTIDLSNGALSNSGGSIPPTGNSSSVGSKQHLRGMLQIARTIIKEDGAVGFMRGIVPRMLVQAPSVAVSWTAYESMKLFLIGDNEDS